MLTSKIKNFFKSRKGYIFVFLRLSIYPISFFTNVLLIRNISVEEYAYYSIALVIGNISMMIGYEWVSSALVSFGAKEKSQTGGVHSAFWTRMILSGINTIFTLIILFFGSSFFNEQIGSDVVYMLIFFIISGFIAMTIQNYFLAVENQVLVGILMVFARLINLVLILVLALDTKVALMILSISNLSFLFALPFIKSNHIFPVIIDKKMFNEIFIFSLWQLSGFMVSNVVTQMSLFIIKENMPIENVSIYNVGNRLAATISDFSSIIATFYSAAVARFIATNDKKALYNFYHNDKRKILLIVLIVHLLLWIFAPLIFTLLYEGKYDQSVSIFKILLISSFFRFLKVFYTPIANATRGYRFLQITNVIEGVILLILMFYLIKPFGIIGIAYANVVSYVLFILIRERYFNKLVTKLTK